MAKIKILKLCATEKQTYFLGEVIHVPSQASEALANAWIAEGIAERIEENDEVKKEESAGEPESKKTKSKAKNGV